MVDGNDDKGGGRVHREHLGGKQMKVSTRQKGRMPSALVNYPLQGVLFPSLSTEEKTVLEVRLDNRWLGKIFSVPPRYSCWLIWMLSYPMGGFRGLRR